MKVYSQVLTVASVWGGQSYGWDGGRSRGGGCKHWLTGGQSALYIECFIATDRGAWTL